MRFRTIYLGFDFCFKKVFVFFQWSLKIALFFRAKRAAWRWNRDRAGIASRWSWLLAQISDLEYRIHQHSDLHNQIKRKKGAVALENSTSTVSEDIQSEPPPQQSLNGYRGILPGNTKALDIESPNIASDTDTNCGSSRTRGFQRSGFRKRKLLQTTNLHTISKKAARQRFALKDIFTKQNFMLQTFRLADMF